MWALQARFQDHLGVESHDHCGRPASCHHPRLALPWSSFQICPPVTVVSWRASVPACWNTWRECLTRGIGAARHGLASLLMTAVAAVLAGARSFTAVSDWVADAPPQVLEALGVRFDPLTRQFQPPGEATIRRVLETVDAAALDAAVGSWLAVRVQAGRQGQGRGGGQWRRMAHRCGAPVTPAATGGRCTCWPRLISRQAPSGPGGRGGKTNEITRFAPLLASLALAGCVVTADALHASASTRNTWSPRRTRITSWS
jgi:hypothetical protein